MTKSRYGKTKSFGGHARWMQVKKVDRPKQVWVWDNEDERVGHWEKR